MAALFVAVAVAMLANLRTRPSSQIVVSTEQDVQSDSVVVGPVQEINLALLADGVEAWPDLGGSELRNPPFFLELLPLTIPQWQLPVGVEVKFTCPDTAGLEVCDAWIFYYSCPASCAEKYQGGMPGLLSITPGWERSHCAPQMVTGAPGTSFVHQMRAFRKQLAKGQSTTLTVPGPEKAEFLAFGIDALGVDCAQHAAAGPCNAVFEGRCKWDAAAQVCRVKDCKAQAGPWPNVPRVAGCAACPWEGLKTRPLSDGPIAP